jgi:hypothetical protein
VGQKCIDPNNGELPYCDAYDWDGDGYKVPEDCLEGPPLQVFWAENTYPGAPRCPEKSIDCDCDGINDSLQ